LQFKFDTIRVATQDFSDTNKLGQGGFGAVYRVSNPVYSDTHHKKKKKKKRPVVIAVSKLFAIPERDIFSG